MDETFVIVGPDGTEHEFPSGMDPQKAAAIVRGQAAPTEPDPDTIPIEQRTLQQAHDAAPAMLKEWATKVLPAVALPGIIGGAAKYGGPVVSKAISAATSPGGQAAIGAAYGGYHGGVPGAVAGGATGYALGKGSSAVGALLERMGIGAAPAAAATAEKELPPALKALMEGANFDELSAVVGANRVAPAAVAETAVAPAAQTGASRLQNELQQRIDWRTTDAVPIDAIKRDISQGGSIIEAGESIPGLSDRIAQLLKNPTPSAMAEAQRLATGIRQRGHISAKASGSPRP